MVVLVAYATDHGSTRGVAGRIAGRLRLRGVGAEACAVADVLEISRYDAVVLGSAIHGGKWLPEARQLAGQNAAPLRERPVWLFSVSTAGDEESMFPPRVADRLRASKTRHRASARVAHGTGGVKMAWVPIRRQMTCGWPGTRSAPKLKVARPSLSHFISDTPGWAATL